MYYYYPMNTLPESVINKIMLFNSHPIADIIKDSTIFKYIRIHETEHENKYIDTHFNNGCFDKYFGEHTCRRVRERLLHYSVDSDKADYEYNLGYIHHPSRDDFDKFGFEIRFRIRKCNIPIEIEESEHIEEEDESDSDSD
jgi:hypothetical protein